MKPRGAGAIRWTQAWARARSLGPRRTLGAAFHVAKRLTVRRWRKLRALLVGTQVGRRELARALGVDSEALPEVAERFRHGIRARLPVGPDDAKAILTCLERHSADVIQSTISAADRICGHVFDLLGSGRVDLGPKIDWHRDFKSGYRWDPRTFYTDIPYGHVAGVDIKVPWELSRGQHLPVLAQAYVLTGDERYAGEVVAQIRHWLTTNLPQFGVNWACPMDVAIRSVNWLWAVALLADSKAADTPFLIDLFTGLIVHGRFLMGNLEVGPDGITSNHYLANVVGLLYLGLGVRELRESEQWRKFALEALGQEMHRQVLPDGVDYESSIPYHRLVTEMFLSAALLCRRHHVTLPTVFLERLARMLEFVQAYTKPNGRAPQVGDADDGRLHVLHGYGTTDFRDHRHLLALGALLFEREDWWLTSGPAWPEVLWFGGARNERWNRPPTGTPVLPQSAAFSHAGLYIVRDEDDYVLFNCSPVGTRGIGNHKHNDLLSLEVHLGGEDILVDPGSYLYTPDPDARNAFRSTRAHATVMIDAIEQNRFMRGTLFALQVDAHPRVLAWEKTAEYDRIVAEHDGYCRLANPVVQRRTVMFLRGTTQLEVVDEFRHPQGRNGTHDLAWTFPFAPGCSIEPAAEGWVVHTTRQHLHLTMPRNEKRGDGIPVSVEIVEGWVSPRYGVREKASALRWRWQGKIPLTVRFTMGRV